jgi:serine-type D-Ala-D-Ala carboxypeptidase/endopeptidase
LVINSPARADDNDLELIQYIEEAIEKNKFNSLIFASIHNDEIIIQAFGNDQARLLDTLPNPDTLFEISSVSKNFLGSLIAIMIDKGEINLSDSINLHLPKGIHLKPFDGQDVTVLDILTHHSGLPTLPTDYQKKDDVNPFKNYTRNDLWKSVNAFNPTRKPGAQWQYSNFAIAILAEAIAQKKGKSYFELLSDYILKPLAMNDTVQTLRDDQTNRLAQGHKENGTETDDLMELGALRAASFMISSPNDMIKYIHAHMGGHPLSAALKRSHKIYSTGVEVALGWEHTTGSINRFNYGTSHGYRAFAGFNEDGSKGVVVMTNTRYGTIDIGRRVLDPSYPLPILE